MQLSNFQELPRVLKEFIEYGARGLLPPSYNPAQALTPTQYTSTQSVASTQSQFNLNTNPFLAGKYPNLVAQQQQQQQQLSCSAGSLARGPGATPVNSKPSIAGTTNIETLLVANENDSNSKPVAPSESIQDKIGFIFNNLSLSNLQVKSDELKDVLKEDFWDWIAHYLVVKRVSIEPNFHTLYSHFIESLKKESLNENILAETYRNIKVKHIYDRIYLTHL